MQATEVRNNETTLDVAYDVGIQSYEWMLRRLEAVEDRIQRLMVFATTLTAAVPLIVVGLRKESDGNLLAGWAGVWIILALITYAFFVIVSIVARQWGGVAFPNVGKLPKEWLNQPKGEFVHMVIRTVGEHHSKNSQLVERKSLVADIAVGIFVVEGMWWGFWCYSVLIG